LRELLAQIERLPESAESDRMLREVRARIVDLDTGVTPRAMLPVDQDPALASVPEPPMARAARVLPSPRRKPAPDAPSRVVAPTVSSAADDRDWLAQLGPDGVLNLGDPVPPSPPGDTGAGVDRRPWTRGLRG
jgi:hypothetical protein